MIVICEECGKKYRINPKQIKGSTAKFKCKSCNHLVLVLNPDHEPSAAVVPDAIPADSGPPVLKEPPVAANKTGDTMADIKVTASDTAKLKGMGLRGKMLILFFAIPITIITVSGLLYLWQLNKLSSHITGESSKVVQQMAEDIIANRSRSVAKQCKLFIESHPELVKEGFNKDAAFKGVAVQKVGTTGYTALYEIPGPDGIWRTWAHVNPKIIGMDMSKLAKPLGDSFPGFWKVYTGGKAVRESQGYYTWKDQSGKFREKSMVCTPVTGTPYIVAATTYLDEFTKPIKTIETQATRIAGNVRNIIIGILCGTIVLIGLVVSMYGYAVTRKIKALTDIADRISIGELDMNIDIDSSDEIGALAQAIGRMQESIRLSIERLRRRKSV